MAKIKKTQMSKKEASVTSSEMNWFGYLQIALVWSPPLPGTKSSKQFQIISSPS
jgi:hypothetical protein